MKFLDKPTERKKLLWFLACTLGLSWIQPSDPGSVFILQVNSSSGMKGTVTLYYDKPGCRSDIDISVNSGFRVQKSSLRKASAPELIYQLDAKSKTYSTVDVSNAADLPTEPAVATLLGSDTLLGYACYRVQIKQGIRSWEMWTAPAIKEYFALSGVMNRLRYIGNHGVHEALKAIHAEGFPVRTLLTDKDGTTRIELENLERRKLDPALFEVPDGYTKAAYNPYPENMPAGGRH